MVDESIMAVKIAPTVVALIIIISALCGSSQPVPDGLVYTEIQKTLVQGTQGVLTCRFYGKPWAVYWDKGHDPEDLTPLLLWHVGAKSGPRYSDGSCDIDDNYSLIIKNVSTADAGRIYCTVSNYIGILIDNYTDVSVANTAITTNPQVILHMRQAYGILQCTVHIKARRVSWRKGTTSSANESLVVIEKNQGVAEISGAGYDEGMYNITHDYSLVIKEVQIHHEGLYICEATDFDTGISFRNHSFVNVIAPPLTPFPTIQECLNTNQYDANYCTLVAKSRMTLTCEAMKYYPALNLIFLHRSRMVEPLDIRESNNTDGTKNKKLTIATSESKELYTCVASNIPGTSDNKSTSVLLHDEDKFESFVLVIIVILFAVLILISSVVYFIWRKKHLHYSSVPQRAMHLKLEDFDVKNLTMEKMQALEQRVDHVLMKHYRRIYDAIETKPVQTEKIIHENKIALFDTHQMLVDWQQRPTSRISQYRKLVQDAFFVSNESDHIWPSNDELKSISRHLTQESMEEICKKLKIRCKSDYANDDGKRFDSLREWRNKVAEKLRLEEKHEQLSVALQPTNFKGLLPILKGQFIYKAELVDMAFQMLMQDLLPIAEALGIYFTKLITYIPAFQQPDLEVGTIDILSKLLNKIKVDMFSGDEKRDTRVLFCTKLNKLQYRNVGILGMCVYEMSYGELFRIAEAMAHDTRENNAVKDIQGGTSQCDEAAAAPKIGPREEARSLGAPSALRQGEDREEPGIEKAESVPEQLGEPKDDESKMKLPKGLDLRGVLQLTDEDIANGLEISHPITTYTLLKLWKEKPRQSVFNYRAALAYELRIMKMPGLADEVIAGKYITKQTSLAFIEDMVRGLNQDQIRSLGELLWPSGGKRHWHTTTPFNEITKEIYDWVAAWTTSISGFLSSNAKNHRDLNDKLVENGFLDLAREIMIIEQQHHRSS